MTEVCQRWLCKEWKKGTFEKQDQTQLLTSDMGFLESYRISLMWHQIPTSDDCSTHDHMSAEQVVLPASPHCSVFWYLLSVQIHGCIAQTRLHELSCISIIHFLSAFV